MTRLHHRSLLAFLLIGCCLASSSLFHLIAAPNTSPSARQAAKLKYNPPPGWIRHYLGDDRYKIAGGTWRLVSTQMDTYYHRPNCPNMMRQSPDIVIGFNSPRDAVEANYNPDPLCQPEQPFVQYAGIGPSAPVSNDSGVAQTVTLSDGTSTITLPTGWRRLRGFAQDMQAGQGGGMRITADMFQPTRGRGILAVSTINLPPNIAQAINVSSLLTPEGFRTGVQNFNTLANSSGTVNNRLSNAQNILSNVSVRGARLGNLRGILLTPRRGARIPGLSGSAIYAANGNKVYVVQDQTRGAAGANTIIRSLQAR